MIDFELLGGLIGSAWRDAHTDADSRERTRAYLNIVERSAIWFGGGDNIRTLVPALRRTMEECCYKCGEPSSTRWAVGVYTCPMCAIKKVKKL